MLSKNKEEIIDKLTKYLNDYPEIRFCQALYNLGIIENVEVESKHSIDIRSIKELMTKDHFYDGDSLVIKRMNKYNYNDEAN